ncbi:glycerophosphodiester phosphodiesterase family protein [Petrimonas mucosa]|jgi:glycerophosphoryl diester phosphodiesterase|uniref:Glycerophosphodiester phosphodiesterase 1 n=1 Tax=Petrimonas mucosa TaxID=1642646 RepID=A0A1G4G6M5_9BACT|nr:glycerophosphodiester phosphodiesterase family protein [Petrimonas mucosa]SCM57491.1 Glycerophosphodiester phosphodiesterase 1 [Petrimonas mucosa]
MRKIIFSGLFMLLLFGACTHVPKATQPVNRAERILEEIHNPKSDYVVVIAHRGDWRNYPENSIPAIESVIRMGVDVVELDVMLTADSVLVLCHDRTIDRTTTGKGLVSEVTYAYIDSCFLRAGHNHPTDHKIPTLRKALEVCKDRIIVNIDKGFEYYDLVIAITEELGVTDQVLIKGKRAIDVVNERMGKYPNAMMYMPIIDINRISGQELFRQYVESGTVPVAYEVCWDQESPELHECLAAISAQPSRIWVNTLWPSLCGGKEAGMYDDYAFENGMETYQKVLDLGASMIQTDRPELLIQYLRKIGRHD